MSHSSIDPEADRLMRAGRLAEALPLAERAIAGATECLPGHSVLASLLHRLGRAPEALDLLARAAALPGKAQAYDGLAYVATELGQHERANLLYRRATELEPDRPRAWYNLACSERSFGRLQPAELAIERSIALDARHYPSFLLRSELHVQALDANHIEDLERRLAAPGLALHGRIFLGYALAKELDDVGRFDDAFTWFSRAAGARRSMLRYDVAADEGRLRRIAQLFCDRLAHEPTQAAGHGDIFVIGLPRSGTTLLERILTGLARVRSNGETENFSQALGAAAAAHPEGPATRGDPIERAAAADPTVVAAHYARLARPGDGDQRIVEKLPTNSLCVGAIRRALPAANILMVRREPLDSCFAMYRALFGEAYPFSYDFEELARYYAAHEALMRHWSTLYGDALYPVVYEDLVREPERVGAALAAHCGLSWQASAVRIESNRSVSLTASAAQVRRPIYGSSSGRWRRYRRHLTPLIAALRRHGVAVPDDA